MSEIDRLPPHSLEAEEATLGSLLIDPDALYEVANFLKPEAFYREQNRWIFEAILSLHDRREPLDFITLTEELRKQDRLEELGGEAYLIDLLNVVPTAVNAASYAHIVESHHIRRNLLSAAGSIANLAYDEQEAIDVIIDR
ncbi:MAG: replicative DNA helicase, partial [Methylococcales bacterium]|nr:replicative DNA helicase [Methylococcales bacterium]